MWTDGGPMIRFWRWEQADAIGWHLQMAMYCSRMAALAKRGASNSYLRGFDSDGDMLRRSAASDEGAAAGHAFRAAELAYDMGQRHGGSSTIRAAVRAVGSIGSA